MNEQRVKAARDSCGTSASYIQKTFLSEAVKLQKLGCRKILDFGAGTGALAAELRKQGLFPEIHASDLIPYETFPTELASGKLSSFDQAGQPR